MFSQVQVRKWIRNLAALQAAAPTAKLVQKVPRGTPNPSEMSDDNSDTESFHSGDSGEAAARHRRHAPSPASGKAEHAQLQSLRGGDLALRRTTSLSDRPERPELEVDGKSAWWEDLRAARELLSLGSMSSAASECL